MSDKTSIEWTDATWNPLRGCSRVSEGCRNCYAEGVAKRFSGLGLPYEGLIAKGGQWNGQIKLVPELLDQPWRWTRGRRIFVNSMSDLFHEHVPFEYVAAIFWLMSVTDRHTYQILTKRPARMLEFVRWLEDQIDYEELFDIEDVLYKVAHDNPVVAALPWEGTTKRRGGYDNCGPAWPFHNVWLGVSVEDQKTADERIPLLLQMPAAVRWISAEPLLGPIDLKAISFTAAPGFFGDALDWHHLPHCYEKEGRKWPGLNWVVVGGESGREARPMHPDWARSLRDQCAAAGVAFLFKQWGEWAPALPGIRTEEGIWMHPNGDTFGPVEGERFVPAPLSSHLYCIGKRIAGRMLDGVLHDGYPEVQP